MRLWPNRSAFSGSSIWPTDSPAADDPSMWEMLMPQFVAVVGGVVSHVIVPEQGIILQQEVIRVARIFLERSTVLCRFVGRLALLASLCPAGFCRFVGRLAL